MLDKKRTLALSSLKGIAIVFIAYFYHYRNDFCINIGVNYPFDITTNGGGYSGKRISFGGTFV